jgi:hypothetical protein
MFLLVSALATAAMLVAMPPGRRSWTVFVELCPQLLALEFGFLGVLVATLLVVRLCGYRLLRGRHEVIAAEAPTEVAGASALQSSGRRSSFRHVIVLLLLLVAILFGPALHLQQRRQSQVESVRAFREWQRVGASPIVDGNDTRKIVGVSFPSRQSPPEAALRMLNEPQNVAALTLLNLSGNRITDAQMPYLAKLENLQSLDLDNTRITDAGLVHLYGLKNLGSVNLSGTQVTPQGIERLQKELPNCQIQSTTAVSTGR